MPTDTAISLSLGSSTTVSTGDPTSPTFTVPVTITSPSIYMSPYSEGAALPETPPAVDYIREMHEDDPLLMEFADIIERNPGLWHLMSMLHQVGQDLGDGVVEWHADTDAVLHDVIRTRLKVVLNNKRGTSLARSR